jgi:hypothetical protein
MHEVIGSDLREDLKDFFPGAAAIFFRSSTARAGAVKSAAYA